jgi:hypothetical protein
MSVGGIRGGGKGAGGAKGASGKGGAGGAGGAGKAGGGGFAGKVDQSAGLVGPSGLVGAEPMQGGEPVLAMQAAGIAQALAHGQIKTKSEATKKFVAEVLKQKLKMQSKALTDKIADALQDDPNLSQRLDRMWSKG